jgi:hypothetical protein
MSPSTGESFGYGDCLLPSERLIVIVVVVILQPYQRLGFSRSGSRSRRPTLAASRG